MLTGDIHMCHKIGSGAFGAVYEATVPHSSLNLHHTEYVPDPENTMRMKVAVKMMKG